MLETSRLTLRRHTAADVDAVHRLYNNPAVLRYLSVTSMSSQDAWFRLLRYVGHWSLFGFGIFLVEEKTSGRFVGEVGFMDFRRQLGPQFDAFPEAMWILDSGAHGKGYAAEAVLAAHQWLHEAHRPGQTVCIINPDNSASQRLARKLEYEEMGRRDYQEKEVLTFRRALK